MAYHTQAYVYQYDLLKGLKKGGTFLLNCIWNEEELDKHLPAAMKRYIAKNDVVLHHKRYRGLETKSVWEQEST